MAVKKLFVSLITLLLCSTIPAGASAEETVTAEYVAPAGARVMGEGVGILLFPNQNYGYNYWPVKPLGGAKLFSEGRWNNVLITTEDAIYGADAGISACFHHPSANTYCAEQDLPAETRCGSISLLDAPFESDTATIWVYAIVVMDDLTTCGGSHGLAAGVFS